MRLKPSALYMKVAALAHVTIRDYYTNNYNDYTPRGRDPAGRLYGARLPDPVRTPP